MYWPFAQLIANQKLSTQKEKSRNQSVLITVSVMICGISIVEAVYYTKEFVYELRHGHESPDSIEIPERTLRSLQCIILLAGAIILLVSLLMISRADLLSNN